MKKWLWGVLTGVILTIAALVTIGVIAWRAQQRAPEIKANSVLVLDLHGDIPEQIPPDIPGRLLGLQQRWNFVSLLQAIGHAAKDRRITAILVEPAGLGIGWAKLEQIRTALEKFKRTGKKVFALMEVGGSKEYFLASVADKVYLSPVGDLDLKGMRIEVMFFKDTLAKLGIQADLEHIGRYKNFSDQFTSDKMSPAFREVENSLLDSIYTHFINVVAVSRHQLPDDMRHLIENYGPFDADAAARVGLVDGLRYEDQILDEIKAKTGNHPVHKVPISDYVKIPQSARGGNRIALVYAVGTITSGQDEINPVEGGKTMGSKSMAATLHQVGNDSSIKGVIVRIDSPGGDAFASDKIWRAMNELHKKKPMVISMSDTAASGGYYIAMTGDPIVAEPGTLTGSIGIVYGKLNLKGFYDKVGITKEIIARGKFAAMDSDYGPYTPEQRARVRSLMEAFYNKFVGKVAAARKMSPEQVDQLGQGRVWTGEQAKSNGLVDDLGGLSQALDILKHKLGLPADAPVQLVEFPKKKSLLETLLSRAQQTQLRLPAGVSSLLSQWRLIENVSRNPLRTRMPYAFRFR